LRGWAGGESTIFTQTGASWTQTTVVIRDSEARGAEFADGSASDFFLVAMCRMAA
jgi:hypothetical protein